MQPTDVHLGGTRPLGYDYWPLPEDNPGVEVQTESIRTVAPDGGLARGLVWTRPGHKWRTAIVLSHPRADFSVHYANPILAAAGYAVCGFGTRYMNNDIDCNPVSAALDVKMMVEAMRERGAENVILFGNSGGSSLTAFAQSLHGVADAWVGCAAHIGEGHTLVNRIDPSVSDETDPFSVVPELDMYNPDNGWRPWPNPSHYEPEFLERYRAAQWARVARLDATAKESLAFSQEARERSDALDRETESAQWRYWRARAVWSKYMVIYRTLADPAYLDPGIDPDDRRLGSLFAHPDPMEANYRRNGLARTMTARGWLATWSALSSPAGMETSLPKVTVPSLLVHPTGDTDIRMSHAKKLYAWSGAQDKTLRYLKGAPHYMEGYRPEALAMIVEWLRERFPSGL
jgi:pimeloyl-ACP methyl ester carboxylesterase